VRKPARFRDLLDRAAADEARTLAAIGGGDLAATFLRAYEAAEALQILSPEAAFVVRVETKDALAAIDHAPGLSPDLPLKPSFRAQRPRREALLLLANAGQLLERL
jgi:hypothetical protein